MEPPADPEEEEARGRRVLGLHAGATAATGLALVVAGGPVGRALRLPAPLVRVVGSAALAGSVGIGIGSVAEDWTAVTRRVAVADMAGSAVLLGLAARGGGRGGRAVALFGAAVLGVVAGQEVRSLLRAQGPVVA